MKNLHLKLDPRKVTNIENEDDFEPESHPLIYYEAEGGEFLDDAIRTNEQQYTDTSEDDLIQ